MVFIKYHKEKIETEYDLGKLIKESEYERLENMLKDIGWTNLKWCPGHPACKKYGWVLIGCPPNYHGEYSDYYEEAIITLVDPKKPYENTGEILVRNYLQGPVFEGLKGKAWE